MAREILENHVDLTAEQNRKVRSSTAAHTPNFAALIARLEKATGPDRELDCAIAVHPAAPPAGVQKGCDVPTLLGPNVFGISGVDEHAPVDSDVFQYIPMTVADALSIPRYTASIDDALTLVPPECWGEIAWSGVLGVKENPRTFPIVTLGPGEAGTETQATTIPIALCIAALKARAALSLATGAKGEQP